MNIYYLKKYRKKAKQRIRIIFQNNEYNVMNYNYRYVEWRLIHANNDYVTPNLYVAKQTLARERRKYILGLVKDRREINKNKELAKL